jgi:hypothetical protein
MMTCHYPTPEDLGLQIPHTLLPERFCAGFRHALKGGKLDNVRYLRRSFRLGFRSAILYLRYLRRQQGIIELPVPGKIRFRTHWLLVE